MKPRCDRCGAFGRHDRCPEPYERSGAANPRWDGGKSSHPLYWIYHDMIARCTRPTHARWPSYGGRGIEVCQRWRDSFWTFVEDMGERPDGLVLDRIDNDGGYHPDNCRWTTYFESNRNRRPTAYQRKGNP